MNTELRVRPKKNFTTDRAFAIELFLNDWLSSVCRDDYIVKQIAGYGNWSITFASAEDQLVVKLTDLPKEFSKYVELDHITYN